MKRNKSLTFAEPAVYPKNKAVYFISAAFNSKVVPLAIFLLGLVAIHVMWSLSDNAAKKKREDYFNFRCREVVGQIEERMKDCEQILRGVQGLFITNKGINRNEFQSYYKALNLEENISGVQGVGFSLLIPSSELEMNLRKIQKEGFPEYRVKPEGKRDLYSSIIFLEPFSGRNLRAFGYDMFSEPVRKAAMEKARDNNEPAISGKVELVQETGKDVQAGVLMYLPVYKKGMPYGSVDERRKNILGWAYSPYRMNDLMKGVFGDRMNDLDIQIYDGESVESSFKLYDSPIENSAFTDMVKKVIIPVNGRNWTILIHSLPALDARGTNENPNLFFYIGIPASLFLSFLGWFIITGRKRAVDMAQRRETLYKNLMRNANSAILVTDSHGRIIDANEEASKYFDYSPEEFKGMNIEQLHPEEQSPEVKLRFGKLIRDGKLQFESVFMRKKGKTFHAEANINTINFGGEMLTLAVINDITDRKLKETLLAESEERYRSVITAMNEGVIFRSKDGLLVTANPKACEILGVTIDQISGDGSAYSIRDAIREDGSPLPEDEYPAKLSLKTGISYSNTILGFYKPDGKLVWISINSEPLIDKETKSIKGVVTTFSDVTERKSAELELRKNREQLNLAIEGSGAGLWDWKVQTGETEFNERWCEIIGYSLKELEPLSITTWLSLVHPDDLVRSEEQIKKHFSGQIPYYECEARIKHKNGNWIWILDRGKVTEWDNEGNPVRMTGTHLDINERKILEEESKSFISRLNLAARTGKMGVWELDINKNLVEWNDEMYEIYGIEKGTFVSYEFWMSRILNQDVNIKENSLKRAADSGSREEVEFRILRFDDGTVRQIYASHSAIMENGKVASLIGINIDVTRRAEEITIQNEKKIMEFMNGITDFFFTTDREFRISRINKALLNRIGADRKSIIGQPVEMLMKTAGIEGGLKEYENVINKNESMAYETEIIKEGVRNYYEINTYPTDEGLSVFIKDITERKHIEVNLHNSEEQMKRYTARLLSIREEERFSLAREIHDELGQILSVIKIDLGMLKNNITDKKQSSSSEKNLEAVENLYSMIDKTLVTVRRIMTELRSEVLDTLGFIDAVKSLSAEYNKKFGLDCRVNTGLDETRMDKEQSLAMFRVCQEALANIHRHAGAKFIEITIFENENNLCMTVTDDGVGIEEIDLDKKQSFGIVGMRERISLLSGTFKIGKKAGGGTELIVSIPYN